VADAIRRNVLLGSSAIGIAAAFGLAVGARKIEDMGFEEVRSREPGLRAAAVALSAHAAVSVLPQEWNRMCANMAATRPTAPDLFRCIDAMKREVTNHQGSHPALIERLTTRADELQQARTALDLRLADEGAAFIKDKMRVLVQGNTGALATGGFGMSFGAVKRAKADGALPLLLANLLREARRALPAAEG